MSNHIEIIAEAGVNHNGSIEMAYQLIDAAVDAGADTVKFQMFKADNLVSKSAPMAAYQQKNTGTTRSQHALLKELELSEQDFINIAAYCGKKDIELLVTPFDEDCVTFLHNELNMQRFKVSSGDLTNVPLLWTIARTQCPIIISTGMATTDEIKQAMGVLASGYYYMDNAPTAENIQSAYQMLFDELSEHVTILHCTSEYPAPLESVNLNAMRSLRNQFFVDVGFSDHTAGIHIPLAASVMGATIIEKHFTLDKSLSGPDHRASLNPAELKQMIQQIREVEIAKGDGKKAPMACELENRKLVRKSLIASRPIKKGEIITPNNLTIMRPGEGLPPVHYWDFIGQVSKHEYEAGEYILP